MDDTSKDYDAGFHQTMAWLAHDVTQPQPVPEADMTFAAKDDWYKGRQAAFAYHAEVARIESQTAAQIDDLIMHTIACVMAVLGTYLVCLCSGYAEKGLGVLVLVAAYNLFKSTQPYPTVNKE